MTFKEILRESWAVALRDIYKNFSIWKELLMILLITAITLGLGKGISLLTNSGDSYVKFFSSGILGYMIIVVTLAVGTSLVNDKKGWSKILLVTPISRISILIGKTIYLLSSAIKSYLIIAILILIYTKEITIIKVALLLLVIITLVFTFLGMAFLVSAFITRRETAQTFISISAMICLLFSGTIYKISEFPSYIQYLFYINPATYGVDAIRYVMTGTSNLGPILTFMVLFGMFLIFPVLGTYLYEKRLRNGDI
jgi:ABC-2 type transport system permease protein